MKTTKSQNLFLFLTFLTISFLIRIDQSKAGNGYYLGADYVRNSIETSTTTTALGSSSTRERKLDSDDYGLRFGYRHKINEYLYISPELFYQSVDKSDYLYSTTMKAGFSIQNLSLFGSLGYSEIDAFNNSSENFGGGFEYKISDNFSFGGEYIKFGSVKTSDTELGVRTDKRNDLDTVKFGITYYFHE